MGPRVPETKVSHSLKYSLVIEQFPRMQKVQGSIPSVVRKQI
jgi:hypothetical protein